MFSVPILLRSMVIYLLADFFETQEDKALDKLLKLEAQFNSNKRQIEQWVNSWSFGDFFMGKDCESMDNEKVLKQFGDILVFYWSRRAKKNCFQTEILLLNMVKDCTSVNRVDTKNRENYAADRYIRSHSLGVEYPIAEWIRFPL